MERESAQGIRSVPSRFPVGRLDGQVGGPFRPERQASSPEPTPSPAPRTRKTTRSTRSRSKPKPAPLDVPAGERLWFLDVPFRITAPGAVWDPVRKLHVHTGVSLPPELIPFRSASHTWLRWLEDDANGTASESAATPEPGPQVRPRQLQIEGAAAISDAASGVYGGHRARGVLVTDEVGTGKSLTAWLGALAVARDRGAKNVLVLVDRPKQVTIAHWRRTILGAGEHDLRVLICSPDELAHLLVRGRPRWPMDLVIADECHLYRNVETQRVRRFRQITRFKDAHDRAPFVIYLTATPANHPAELTYLAPLLAQVHDEPTQRWENFGARLAEADLPVSRVYGRWGWDEKAGASPALQSAATTRIRAWLTDADPPLAIHRAAPWGPAPLDLMPVTLSAPELLAYRTAWSEFEAAIVDLAADRAIGSDITARTARGRAAVLRFRQKASLLRVGTTATWAVACVEAGRQAVVSCEFVGAAADPIADAIQATGIGVARLYGNGRSGRDLELQRLEFQRGSAPVVVFTPTTSLSLHAQESLGTDGIGSGATREGVMHNVRYSGLAGRQILGRSHRDHQVCPWLLAYAEGTVEERIAQIMIGRFRSTNDLAGADSGALVDIAAALGVSWLPIGRVLADEA